MTKNTKLNIFITLQLICLSGGLFAYVGFANYFIPLWCLSCFIYFKKHIGKTFASCKWNFKVMLFLILWPLISTFVVNSGNIQNKLIFSIILIIVGSALYQSSVNFYDFRAYLLKSANYIFSVSLIVHILHNVGVLSANVITFGDTQSIMSLYIFHTEWGSINTPLGEIYRFSSVFWEVGQCQIVLVYILSLFFDELVDINKGNKYIFRKYGVLLLSIIMTGSTTGYLCLALIMAVVLYYRNKSNNKLHKKIGSLLLGVTFLVALLSSSVVSEKREQSKTLEETSSYSIRLADNIACLQATINNPIWGLGFETKEKKKELEHLGSLTSSNGWLNTSAALGFIYIFAVFYFMYKGIKRMNLKVHPILISLILIISQCNEYFIFFPYIFMYVFKFKAYDTLVNIKE